MTNQARTGQKLQIGSLMVAKGLLSVDQLNFVLQKQRVTGERIGELLIRLSMTTEYAFASLLSEQRQLPLKVGNDLIAEKSALDVFNRELCIKHGFLPLRRAGNTLEVVLGNGDPRKVSQLVTQRCGLKPELFQGEFGKVMVAIRHSYYFAFHPVDQLLQREIDRLTEDRDHVLSPDALLDHLLHYAVRERASDIHIIPEMKALHIMFRVDGVVRPIVGMPTDLNRVILAIKLRSGMDISDQRRPQDGSFFTEILGSHYSLRVSTVTTPDGESVVMRLLSSGSSVCDLEELGFLAEDHARFKHLFSQPSGMILLTGPTGSGKSTTLHAALRAYGMDSRNVLTVEDPIEYKVPTICQTEVNRKSGYTFDAAVRHFLRHDPDVMLIGEIRDEETASVAMMAAETGHLVLSTLHVNTVLGVMPRLKTLGVSSHVIADSLIGVVNQRLVRGLCPHCKEESASTPYEREWLASDALEMSADVNTAADSSSLSNQKAIDIEPDKLMHAVGCKLCGGNGYLGRIPVYEMLVVDQYVSDAVADDMSREKLMKIASERGLITLQEMARHRVLRGDTTVEEVIRSLGRI